jgi:hypothetical protein
MTKHAMTVWCKIGVSRAAWNWWIGQAADL